MSFLRDLRFLARLYRRRGDIVFRPRRSAIAGCYRIDLRARDGAFAASVNLRRGSSDLRTFRQIFVKRDYDLAGLARGAEIARTYRSILGDGTPLILDLGANVGLASLYFASAWPEARIVAVEPAAENYRLLAANVAPHRAIEPVHAAIASAAGAVQIVNPEAEAWAYRTAPAAAGAQGAVAALTVPELLSRVPDAVPFIAKIDIEGFEQELFAANTAWVSRFPVIVVELHDWMLPGSASSGSFLRAIAPLDRDFVSRGENVFSIANTAAGTAHR